MKSPESFVDDYIKERGYGDDARDVYLDVKDAKSLLKKYFYHLQEELNVSINVNTTGFYTYNLKKIITEVSKVTGVPIESIKSKTRKREIMLARRIFMVVARKTTSASLATIGAFVNKDHATVVHANREHGAMLSLKSKHPIDKMYMRHFNDVVEGLLQDSKEENPIEYTASILYKRTSVDKLFDLVDEVEMKKRIGKKNCRVRTYNIVSPLPVCIMEDK